MRLDCISFVPEANPTLRPGGVESGVGAGRGAEEKGVGGWRAPVRAGTSVRALGKGR